MNYQSKWDKKAWAPRKIIYEATNEKLTAGAGLGPLIDAFVESAEFKAFKKCLPSRVGNSSYSSEHLALILLAGFWYGADCLEDLEDFEEDPAVEDKLGGLATSKTIANFLRDFTEQNISDLRSFMTAQGFNYRQRISGQDCSITFDIDSTFHEQAGSKMEGLAMNRDGKIGLDSLLTVDDRGFCYDMDLRSGSTFSSEKADEMIFRILGDIPNRTRVQHYFRGDSAFARENFIRAAQSRSLKGTVTAHGNCRWESHLDEVHNWQPWVYTEEEKQKALKRGRSLPEVSVGYWMYEPTWAPGVKYPIVIKRSLKDENGQTSLFAEDQYKYWGVLSLRGLYPHTPQEILEFHQKRGNMENFIREGKINYDLKHFPCQSLRANHAYGLLALIAHNFLRAMAILMRPDKPHFAKKLRKRFIHIPGHLVSGSGYLRMKIPTKFFKEVMELLKRWSETFKPIPHLSTA